MKNWLSNLKLDLMSRHFSNLDTGDRSKLVELLLSEFGKTLQRLYTERKGNVMRIHSSVVNMIVELATVIGRIDRSDIVAAKDSDSQK